MMIDYINQTVEYSHPTVKVYICKNFSFVIYLTSSPFLTALVLMPATSDPALGSVTQYACKVTHFSILYMPGSVTQYHRKVTQSLYMPGSATHYGCSKLFILSHMCTLPTK